MILLSTCGYSVVTLRSGANVQHACLQTIRAEKVDLRIAFQHIPQEASEVHIEDGLAGTYSSLPTGDAGATMAAAAPSSGKYTVYYHAAGKAFTGRAFCILCLLEEAGAEYEVVTPDAYDGTPVFVSAPAIKTPAGITISQSTAIMATLGQVREVTRELTAAHLLTFSKERTPLPPPAVQELGFAPACAAGAAAALQLSCDAADLLGEVTGGKFATETGGARLIKWLTHLEALFASEHALNCRSPPADGCACAILWPGL